jgi:hypothetical protein
VSAWQQFLWADAATEATVAVVDSDEIHAAAFLGRLGGVEDAGPLRFAAALELQGSFYDDGTEDERAVFQIDRVEATRGGSWALVEPNGFRLSVDRPLLSLAGDRLAASFFWNINAVMSLLRVEGGRVAATFDPLIDVEDGKRHAADLPFGEAHPRVVAFALIERWTGMFIAEDWFVGKKPTFVVHTPAS